MGNFSMEEDVPTWALPPESAVNLHKVFLEWEGLDSFDYTVPSNLLLQAQQEYERQEEEARQAQAISRANAVNGGSDHSEAHKVPLKQTFEGTSRDSGGGFSGQLPEGLYGGYFAGTPEGEGCARLEHARTSREAFKRCQKHLYDTTFIWEDDDIDEQIENKKPKNVVSAAWQDVAGGINGLASGLKFHAPDVLFGKMWPMGSPSQGPSPKALPALPQDDSTYKSFMLK
eukprot:Tamp_14002.p2 GENE.Tamp_14002~~Tamp_14002.p2  ORF type:complete len:229 (+),score=43.91 Tamp_14002:933-1619(+)